MRFQDSGGVQILPPPSVQFKLYQGEVLQYKPGASDHQNRTRHGFESTHSDNPQAPTQSERGMGSEENSMPECTARDDTVNFGVETFGSF